VLGPYEQFARDALTSLSRNGSISAVMRSHANLFTQLEYALVFNTEKQRSGLTLVELFEELGRLEAQGGALASVTRKPMISDPGIRHLRGGKSA
jgi:hypothetical protein